jgi:cell division septation protein DedD
MDIALKQRLVGASVLIALAVVVLPMLLGGRPEEGTAETQKIELPPQPGELDFETRRYPLGDTPAPPRPAEITAAPTSQGGPADELPEEPADKGAVDSPGAVAHVEVQPREFEDALQTDAPQAESATETVEAVAAGTSTAPDAASTPAPQRSSVGAAGGRYVVQVASFGSVENATRLSETLRGYGYGVLSDTVSSDVGTLHRVRVGPFDAEAEANAVVAKLRNQVGDVKPRVMDLRPEQAAQVTTPSDPLVRWVVQVGSFSSSDNADKLVGKLRGEGLSAFKESVTSGGSTIYRVRAGPFSERDEAIRVNGQVKERLSLEGVVMSAD